MLRALGVEFEAVATRVEEATGGLPPEELVVANARRKAIAGLKLVERAEPGVVDVALGVDTDVFLDGRALGKATTEEEARRRLLALSGRTHEVLSGVALAGDSLTTGVARSRVTFVEIDEQTLARYLHSGEWRDRAGAYAIQGLGAILVASVDGDFSNVVGLPLQLLVDLAPGLFPSFPATPRDPA